jgi:hypothetical protein
VPVSVVLPLLPEQALYLLIHYSYYYHRSLDSSLSNNGTDGAMATQPVVVATAPLTHAATVTQ